MQRPLLNNYNNKKRGVGCGSAILGTLIVIGAVVVYGIVSLLLCNLFASLRFGNEVGGALMTFWLIGVGIAFVLGELVFVLGQIKLAMTASGKGEGEKMSKIFRISLISAVALSFLLAIFSANNFTELKNDSISEVIFFTTNEYRWDKDDNDISSYSLVCDENGSLSFTVTVKGGKEISLLDSVNSLSEAFKKEHVNCLGYAAHLTEAFKDNGLNTIEAKISDSTIKNAEKLYRDSENEASKITWEMIERILIASGKINSEQ